VSHFDGCFKLIQGVLSTCPHKEKGEKIKSSLSLFWIDNNEALTFCFSLLYIIVMIVLREYYTGYRPKEWFFEGATPENTYQWGLFEQFLSVHA